MIQDINNKRVILQESIRQDERIVSSIKKDNTLIVEYLNELADMEEIEKNIWSRLIKLLIIWVK
jgi:hypothetical protein